MTSVRIWFRTLSLVTNAEIIEAVQRWQAHRYYPPLTCQRDTSHGKLAPVELDGHVVLTCPTCSYLETVIPDAVLKRRD